MSTHTLIRIGAHVPKQVIRFATDSGQRQEESRYANETNLC